MFTKKNKDGQRQPKKYFYAFHEAYKSIYDHVTPGYEKRTYLIISLIIQFFIVYYLYIIPNYNVPMLIHVIVLTTFIYIMLNQTSLYSVQKFIMNDGYKLLVELEVYSNQLYVSQNTKTFNPDKPILKRNENKLEKRDEFAQLLGKAISSYKNDDCFVIGLHGDWGDGKTSVVNMAFERLKVNPNQKFVLFEFSPWYFSNQEDLVSNFFNQLRSFIRKNSSKQSYNDLYKKIELYLRIVNSMEIENKNDKKDLKIKSDVLLQAKIELEKKLNEFGKKIIILIDDIDRLDKDETLSVFKLVKLIGDFSNIIYVLPFDKNKVIEEIKDGKEYIKKIVQLEINMPPVLENQLFDLLAIGIQKIIDNSNIKVQGWNVNRLKELYNSGLRFYIKNIRDLNRLINALKFYSTIKNKDLDYIDFIGITAIQTFDLDLYKYIRSNKVSFLNVNSPESIIVGGTTHYEKFKEVIKKSKEYSLLEEQVLSLLKYLFPTVYNIFINRTIEDFDKSYWRKEYRICDANEFDRFFLYPVEDNALSQLELSEIVNSIDDFEKLMSLIEKVNKEKKLSFFLNRLEDYLRDINVEKNGENLITALTIIAYKYPPKGIWMFKGIRLIKYLVRSVLRQIEDRKTKFNIYTKLMGDENHDLATLIDLFLDFSDYYYFPYNVKNNYSPDFNADETSKELIKIRDVLVKNISGRKESLFENEAMQDIFFWWKKLSPNDSEEIERLFLSNIKSTDKFISFIESSKKNQTIRSYRGERSRVVFDIDKLSDIVDLKLLYDSVISTIENDSQLLSTQNKELLNIFVQCYKGEIDVNSDSWYDELFIDQP